MGDYRVNLDIFAGPLDLLLYLVRKEEVDIYDIPLTKITEQYLHYIELLKSLDIDMAGDFLVMAATLMQIKSAMLLPKDDLEQLEDEQAGDPRAELIRQLLEYKKFKDAANLLGDAVSEHNQRHNRPNTIIEKLKPNAEPDVDMDQVSIWDLLEAFDSIMQATGGASFDISHISDDTPIDLYQIDILHRLQTEGRITFEQVFDSINARLAMIGLFLALLELVRSNLVTLDQNGPAGAIYIRALTDEPAEMAVKNAIESLNVPDEEPEQRETPAEQEKSQAEIQPEQNKPAIPIVEIPPEKTASPEKVVNDYDNEQII